MSEFDKLLPNICDSIAKTAAYVINYADNNIQKEMTDALRNNIQKYVESSEKFKNINKLINRLSSESSDTNVEEILRQFNEGVSSFESNSLEHEYLRQYDRRVAEFKKNLAGVRDDDDDDDDDNDNDNDADLQVTEDDTANLICPISKVRMTEPMKNDICGHVYDKASIVALLQRNSATRCPIVGCSNKEYLNMNHLRSDIVRQMCMDTELD